MFNRLRFAFLTAMAALAAPALAKPPIEAFSDVPTVRSAVISPDGQRVAYISRNNGVDYLAMYDFATDKNEPLIRVDEYKIRRLGFAGSNFIVLTTSEITDSHGETRRFESTESFAYNITTHKIAHLLATAQVYRFQSGLGYIAGIDPDGKSVYMPAFVGKCHYAPDNTQSCTTNAYTHDLLKVDLDTGRVIATTRKGLSYTQDWILNHNGEVVAREDFNEDNKQHEIVAYDKDGKTHTIFKETNALPTIGLVGFAEGTGNLIASDRRENSNFLQLYELALADGKLTGPVRTREDVDIEHVMRDYRQVVVGVGYSGMYPSYELFDPQLNADLKAAIHALPDASVRLTSWSDDFSKMLLYAEGGVQPGRYMLFDRKAKKLTQVARSRPEIAPEDIGEVVTIEYKARDGLKISGLITWPTNVPADKRKNLPMVVMPHGGPEAYDSVGFDWLAQFLANEGYMVFQPNFRGSSGFGAAFTKAGYHEWGRKMQDDITDGVNATQKVGWSDPAHTCIFGWSYGGYAALAGGALTPDLYKCVASIAGPSDLRAMLGFETRQHGPDSNAVTYWTTVIGDPDKDRVAIDAVSPARLAANFKAPVLLIHGAQDTTVEASQSDMMESALKDAGKQVTYIRIKGDDHSLVNLDSRKTALAALSEFLAKYLKPAS